MKSIRKTLMFNNRVITYKNSIKVVSSGAFSEAYKLLATDFENQTGIGLITCWGPSIGSSHISIPNRLDRGEDLDVVIMGERKLVELTYNGKLLSDSTKVLAYSLIACAIKKDSRFFDLSTVDKLKDSLIKAKKVGYSDSVSGEYVNNELIYKLGFTQELWRSKKSK